MMHGALENITQAVGNTPIILLNKVTHGLDAEIYVKCEYLNPGGSHKDRLAANLLRRAEESGLRPGGTIVEATSGNTGASLALLAAVRGYRCIFVMPDKMSQEKIANLRAFGARVVVCPTAVEADDPRSYYRVSRRIADETPNSFYANQYHNPANPEAHYLSSAPEIWQQTKGEFDVFVAGMGTGGTISGCGKYFKEKNADIQIVGVDPVGSLYYDFVKTGRITKPFSYKVEGIGEDFFPTTMNLGILDEIVRVDDKECFTTARDLTRMEGLFVGGSGGAAVAGAMKYARDHAARKGAKKRAGRPGATRILVFLCDGGAKYVSKIFNDDWMRENGFLDDQPGLGTVRDVLAELRKAGRAPGHEIVSAPPSATVRQVIETMKSHSISQLPVIEGGKLRGIVAEIDLLRHLVSGLRTLDSPIHDLVEGDYATVTPDTKVELLQSALADARVAIVSEGDRVRGIVTKIDLIDFLARHATEKSPRPSEPPAPSNAPPSGGAISGGARGGTPRTKAAPPAKAKPARANLAKPTPRPKGR